MHKEKLPKGCRATCGQDIVRYAGRVKNLVEHITDLLKSGAISICEGYDFVQKCFGASSQMLSLRSFFRMFDQMDYLVAPFTFSGVTLIG